MKACEHNDIASVCIDCLRQEIEALKADLTTAESAVADLMELNYKLTAERDRLRAALAFYSDGNNRASDALNHKDTPPKDKRYCCAARGWYNQPCTCNHKE